MKSKEDLTRMFDAAIDATAQANKTQDELYSALYRMYAIENRVSITVYEEMVADLQQYFMCEYGDCFTLYDYKPKDVIKQMMLDNILDLEDEELEEE